MPLETIFKQINDEEKRLRLFLEESLRSLNVNEKDVARLYIGILKIIEEQNRAVKQLHREIEDRLEIHAEENQMVRKLLGTTESAARLRAAKLSEQVVVLREKLYEKERLEEYVAELKKEKGLLEDKIIEIKQTYEKKMQDHFAQVDEEKRILQEALLEMGLRQENLSKELSQQRATVTAQMDEIRKQYFKEFMSTFQTAKYKESHMVEAIMADFMIKMRTDLRKMASSLEANMDVLDLKKLGFIIQGSSLKTEGLKLFLKNQNQVVKFINGLIQRQDMVYGNFTNMIGMLKMLDNASQVYLELIKPIQTEISSLDMNAFQDMVENIFYTQNTNNEIRFLISFDQKLPNIILDANSISLALIEIFINAVEAIQGAGRIKVKIEYNEKQNVFVLLIANNGRPVAESMRYEMFNPYVTDKHGHSGLGLTRARIAVQRMGGDVHLSSSDEENTEFTITIPAMIKINN